MEEKKYEKKFNVEMIDLSNDELMKLFEASVNVFSTFKHDIKSPIYCIVAGANFIQEALENIKDEVTEKGLEAFSDFYYKQALEACEHVVRCTNHLGVAMKYFNLSMSSNGLISKPLAIVESIKKHFRNTDLKIQKNSFRNLEFVFPESISYGIISELITNAVKHNKSKSIIIGIKWGIDGNRFTFEVNDNGCGITNSLTNKNTPLDLLGIRPRGLRLINEIICSCGGHLFFSKSRSLKGTKVYLDFPIIAYYKKGKIYDVRGK